MREKKKREGKIYIKKNIYKYICMKEKKKRQIESKLRWKITGRVREIEIVKRDREGRRKNMYRKKKQYIEKKER